jgi:hypothetical protein
MKKYTNEQLEQNYNTFIAAINTAFENDPRLSLLLDMYSMDELGPNLILAPASGNLYYHNAYDGGYMDHVINVARNAIRMYRMYKEVGGKPNFTEKELLFSAFHHDLGKLGTKEHVHYIPQTSEWHRKNKNELYVSNPELSFMSHTDRTFFLLQEYGIKYNETEYFGMKLADGMFDEDNVKYLKTWNEENSQRSNIGHILHMADYMSSIVERDSIR